MLVSSGETYQTSTPQFKVWSVLVQVQVENARAGSVLKLRRRRSLISAQGWSAATTLGNRNNIDSTLKGFAARETLSGFNGHFLYTYPGFSLRSNPGLKLANAFGVMNRLRRR